MKTQPSNPQENLELTVRKLRLLWLGGLWSIVMFFVLTLFTDRPEDEDPNNTLFFILLGVGLTTTLASFLVKKNFFTRAVEKQQVELVQQGFIVASMLTEVAALLGVLDYFITADRYYYVLFLVAVCGQLLHFPRREHVLNASFRPTI